MISVGIGTLQEIVTRLFQVFVPIVNKKKIRIIKGKRMNEYTITRRRVVVQISTEEFWAESEVEALELANADQANADQDNERNEWITLDEVIEYPTLTEDDILEVN